jgi:ribonucleoside-diphosphate reductase beta chain
LPRPILEYRQNLTPYDYPVFAEAHYSVMQSPWSPYEVGMQGDVIDWEKISETERAVIAGILMGFTLIESGIGCYWREVVAKKFRLPEIVNMATTFSHQETIHQRAYAHLEDTLGLNTYEAFKQDEVAIAKINQFMNPQNLATSLAIFSGAGEGVSLFASFAILLSFSKRGLFKGMQQILSWSILDEGLHSKMGIELFKTLVKQYPDLTPKSDDIYQGFEGVVANEIKFVEQAFNGQTLPDITLEGSIDFIKYRANLKLMELGYEPFYSLEGDYLSIKDFFDTMVLGKSHNDFFAQQRNGAGYSAMLTQDFHGVKI